MKTTLFNRLTAGLLAAVLCLSVLAGCTAKPQKELTRYSTIFYDVFDTVTQVIAYCESEEEFTKQMEALHADLISYNQLTHYTSGTALQDTGCNTYRPYSRCF